MCWEVRPLSLKFSMDCFSLFTSLSTCTRGAQTVLHEKYLRPHSKNRLNVFQALLRRFFDKKIAFGDSSQQLYKRFSWWCLLIIQKLKSGKKFEFQKTMTSEGRWKLTKAKKPQKAKKHLYERSQIKSQEDNHLTSITTDRTQIKSQADEDHCFGTIILS